MRQAFNIDGIDQEADTVVVEIHKSMLVPMVRALFDTRDSGHSNVHMACRSLAGNLRNACRVLYGEAKPEDYNLVLLDPVEETS